MSATSFGWQTLKLRATVLDVECKIGRFFDIFLTHSVFDLGKEKIMQEHPRLNN